MINRIEMELPSYKVSINDGICIINDDEVSITKEDIDNILRTIRLWNNNYIGNGIKEDTYTILLYDGKNIIDKYTFDRAFPEDFSLLLEVIGAIYDRR